MLNAESRLELPPTPATLAGAPVAAWREPVTIDTYEPEQPDRYPAYLNARVYQGSSGRIYPLPFHERISPVKAPRRWDAIHLENRWVRLMIMPELGGRIQVGLDKSNGYDFFYRNNVIKPALVGLAGPWLSGGVEFNWPQHHRPATFLPTDVEIEHETDGAVTVWCSDHDPFARMKGMHGVRLRPDSSVIEVRVRLFNRTDDVQTFLWWANVAAAVNDDYQSFFPTDVHVVADHARRAVTAFPAADRPYYGVDYPARVDEGHPDADRIDWYRNIPVPTSYMCVGTRDDFFGGYDHGRSAGFVHWADHTIAPGKKQWTWGNAPFGWAWDANLTDGDGPYVELMAGVFTDNQPDFSFLAPGETKAFSQYWYPIQHTGPVHQAGLEAAVRLDVNPREDGTSVRLAVAVTRPHAALPIALYDAGGNQLWSHTAAADPGNPVLREEVLTGRITPEDLRVVVGPRDAPLLTWRHGPHVETAVVIDPATEPPAPEEVGSVEQLYLTGLHLEQYRHATRDPDPYWREALRRDPGDTRTNVALAARNIRAGRYADAEKHLRTAVSRTTERNPNPYDGEAHYRLGVLLGRTGRSDEAREALGKATWNAAWFGPAHLAAARIDAAAHRDPEALAHVQALLTRDRQQTQAWNLSALLLRRLGREEEATEALGTALALDSLDWWARHLAGHPLDADGPTCLDVALEYASVGEIRTAIGLLARAAERPVPVGQVVVGPLAHYHRADLLRRMGDAEAAAAASAEAHSADVTWCLASRLDDADMLARTVEASGDDARAWALLGHWLYAHGRAGDAIAAWRTSADLEDRDPVVRRNLAIAAVNVLDDLDLAVAEYRKARQLAPRDARLLYEADQLARRRGTPASERLIELTKNADLVERRDDLTIEYLTLLAAEGRAEEALQVLVARRFQPWEGGEGQALAAWDEVHLALARTALARSEPGLAVDRLDAALTPPASLGEGRHPLANCAHLHLALGDARYAAGDTDGAREAWTVAANDQGDFREMATTPYSDLTAYTVEARRRLGRRDEAESLLDGLSRHADELAVTVPKVDYFATSLPTMLLFVDDLVARRDALVRVLRAQVASLRGHDDEARRLVAAALADDPVNARALDLRRELETRASRSAGPNPSHVAGAMGSVTADA